MRRLFVLASAASIVSIPIFLLGASPLPAEPPLFESNGSNLDQWEFLDLKGGGKAYVGVDGSVPVGYGPEVVHLEGDEALLLAQGVRISEGTILVLWKDPEPKELDADGVTVFEADYPDDLAVARNTRDRRAHFLIEQDSDKGFQLKHQKAGADAEPVVEVIGEGLTHDDSWNRSGWIWQKVRIGEGRIRAKYWSASRPEPEGWPIESDHPTPQEGRVGIKVWSGKAMLARFAVSKDDIPVTPPPLDLALTREVLLIDSEESEAKTPEFRVFVNRPLSHPSPLSLEGELRHEKEDGSPHSFRAEIESPTPGAALELTLAEFSPEFSRILDSLPREPGRVDLSLRLIAGEGENLGSVARSFEFRTADQYRLRFENLRAAAEEAVLQSEDPLSDLVLEATAALNLLALARTELAEANFRAVDRTLEYVEEALDPKVRLADFRFGEIELPALNLAMGAEYSLEVPWTALTEKGADSPLTARLEIVDDLRVTVPIRVETTIAPEDWNAGSARTLLAFEIPHEFPPGGTEPISRPAIREGFHRFLLSLWDDAGNAVWLDNPGAEHSGNFGRRYEVGRVSVTPHPIEASEASLVLGHRPHTFGLFARLHNHGNATAAAKVRVSMLTDGGFEAFAFPTKEVFLNPKETTDVAWTPRENRFAGRLTARFDVHLEEGFQVRAEIEFHLEEPLKGVRAVKENRAFEKEGRWFNQVRLTADEETPGGVLEVRAYTDDQIVESLEWNPSETRTFDLDLEPSLGFHLIHVRRPGQPEIERRLIAPTWETRDGMLLLNGEPFYVKGVNCHGMIPQSPERTRLMMRVLKGIGFNMLRGDYPPPWQLDVAQEENLGWMVLAPFSVTNTDVLKDRHSPHPMKRMREITRRFIPHYVGHPANWFWNNFNEVTGETDDLLAMFYPIYKAMDPYDRPVVYANLTGQDRSFGQDVMGINYYYRPYTPIEELKVLIHGSQDYGARAGVPVIYCEFNNWFGPVYTEGARAVNEMYTAELSPEHPGGFFYQLREDGDRHPGVVVNDDTVWVDPTLERALRRAFADLEISDRIQGDAIPVSNKRPFTLRRVSYELWRGPIRIGEGSLPDLQPDAASSIPLPEAWNAEATGTIRAKVRFETHHGIRCEVEGNADAP